MRLLPVRLLPLVLAATLVAACAGRAPSPSPAGEPTGAPPATELTVFAAASLGDAMDAATAAYTAAHRGTTFVVSADSSATLATQVEQGAPADVFLSADMRNAQRLAEGGFADGAAVVFASNALVVIVPDDNPAEIETPADLARPGVKVIAAGDEVPITQYATRLVENLAGEPGYPDGFAEAYAANVVSREDNVRSVVAKIALGEGDAGIVYATDAAATDEVTAIRVPDAANVPASYAGVAVAGSPRLEAGRAFLEWLAGAEGRAVLEEFGFGAPVQ